MKKLFIFFALFLFAASAYAIPPMPPSAGSDLSLVAGTYTDTYLCTYTEEGTLLNCTTDPASFQAQSDVLDGLAGVTPTGPCVWSVASGGGYACAATLNIQFDDSAAQFKSATASKGTRQFVQSSISDGILLNDIPVVTGNATITTPSLGAGTHTQVFEATAQTLTNKTLTAPAITIAEVDGHTTSTDLTAAQVSNTQIHNYDQAASDVFLILPTAAAGYSFLASVVTAQANHFCVEAGASDKIYLIAAAGTIAAGDDGAAVCMMAAQIGQQFACWTFKTGASSYDWACKAIAIGTSTFEAHASSE